MWSSVLTVDKVRRTLADATTSHVSHAANSGAGSVKQYSMTIRFTLTNLTFSDVLKAYLLIMVSAGT